jgi:hypothetical protein
MQRVPSFTHPRDTHRRRALHEHVLQEAQLQGRGQGALDQLEQPPDQLVPLGLWVVCWVVGVWVGGLRVMS